jgi:hypothetical protein
VIVSLLFTYFTEGIIVVIYGLVKKKPLINILLSSLVLNTFTQTILQILLFVFFRHYCVALLISEVIIWGVEGMALTAISANKLNIKEALLLSVFMNTSSFILGLFLPI